MVSWKIMKEDKHNDKTEHQNQLLQQNLLAVHFNELLNINK